jgi:peptide/nickel transport system ATP-binding protein/oligopeptide transport system ATP-binding protein
MQQRVMIAMALMNEPALLIADEPTTALDVTVQAQIFSLISDLHTPDPSREGIARQDMSMLLITHDMGVVWEMCDRVIVMYASRIVEEGSSCDIFSSPAHPYTQGLLASIPKLSDTGKRLHAIAGQVPSPMNYPQGCRFQDRCPHVFDKCREEIPMFYDLGNGHKAACFKAV